jgi:nitrate reductase NapAB chaperone NapD
MEMEPMDDFEQEVRQALERLPAPAGLKRRLMERRSRQRAQWLRGYTLLWQRLAASAIVAGVLAGVLVWRHVEEQRKGEAVRQQVLTALRVTNRALNEMNAQLVAHDRDHRDENGTANNAADQE